jgi:DNA-binding MarR family transcriptional regulator
VSQARANRARAELRSTAQSDGPRRITELAELEGLAQPTMTILIQELEQEGLVQRERRSDDGRVVLVESSDEQVNQLAAATETLARLVALLQQQPIH